MIYTKEEIKSMLEQKLTHLSDKMKEHLNDIRKTDGVEGLLKLKDWMDNTDTNADSLPVNATNKIGISNPKEYSKIIGDIINADRPDADSISESSNLFASKVDVDAFDTNNKPSTIYRGEYFYLLNKDEYNSYVSSAIKKRTNKKHDFVIDNDTFMNNFVTINKESIEPFMDEDCDDDNQLMCPNCGGVSYHFGLTEDFSCPYCSDVLEESSSKKAVLKEPVEKRDYYDIGKFADADVETIVPKGAIVDVIGRNDKLNFPTVKILYKGVEHWVQEHNLKYIKESRLDNMVANHYNTETKKQKALEKDQKNKVRKQSVIVPSGTSDVKGLVNPPSDSSVTLGADGGAAGGPGF